MTVTPIDQMWLVEALPPQLKRYDPATGSIVETVELDFGALAEYPPEHLLTASKVVASSDGDRVYVTSVATPQVLEIELTTGAASVFSTGYPSSLDSDILDRKPTATVEIATGTREITSSAAGTWMIY